MKHGLVAALEPNNYLGAQLTTPTADKVSLAAEFFHGEAPSMVNSLNIVKVMLLPLLTQLICFYSFLKLTGRNGTGWVNPPSIYPFSWTTTSCQHP